LLPPWSLGVVEKSGAVQHLEVPFGLHVAFAVKTKRLPMLPCWICWSIRIETSWT
jgi:hypothetical protein